MATGSGIFELVSHHRSINLGWFLSDCVLAKGSHCWSMGRFLPEVPIVAAPWSPSHNRATAATDGEVTTQDRDEGSAERWGRARGEVAGGGTPSPHLNPALRHPLPLSPYSTGRSGGGSARRWA